MFSRSNGGFITWKVRGRSDLSNCILNNPSPKNLVIQHDGDEDIMRAIARYLECAINLRSLYISSSQDHGIKSIAHVLAHSNRTLEYFGVCDNKLVCSYTPEFAKIIKKNTKLKGLALQNGLINDEQLEPFIEVLPGSTISGIDFSYNRITTVGAKRLLEVLAASNLVALDLENNPYFESEYSLIKEITPIDSEVIKSINDILKLKYAQNVASFRTSL